jgi:hypothetical protein
VTKERLKESPKEAVMKERRKARMQEMIKRKRM